MNRLRIAFLFVGAVVLGTIGTILLAMTNVKNGGDTVYHPFDILGAAMDAAAVVLLVVGIWQFTRDSEGHP